MFSKITIQHLLTLHAQYTEHTHTHKHPFNGPLSGTTQVSRYQKGKTNLDFTEARDSEWQWHQVGKSAPRSRQITTPAPHYSVFYRPDALPATQPTVSKHWRQNSTQSRVYEMVERPSVCPSYGGFAAECPTGSRHWPIAGADAQQQMQMLTAKKHSLAQTCINYCHFRAGAFKISDNCE